MNIGQIYNTFPLVYPEKLFGEPFYTTKKRKIFRELSSRFKINAQKRSIVKNRYKENESNNEEKIILDIVF